MPQNLDIFSQNYNQPQSNQKLSIELFGRPQIANQKDQSPKNSIKKSTYYRKQIRKTQNQRMFRNMRNQMMNIQEQQQFFAFLVANSQKFDVTQKNLEMLMQCIKRHMGQASFANKIQYEELQIYHQIITILIEQCQILSIYTKAILIKGLVYLTFFSVPIAKKIASQLIIDFGIKQIGRLNIDNDNEMHYLLYYISLMLNITAIMDKNINCYFIQSSLINLICEKLDLALVLRNDIAHQQRSKENINQNKTQYQQKRQNCPLQLIENDLTALYFTFIYLLKNLCREVDKQTQFIQRIISYLVHNQFAKTHNTSEIFQLLTEIFQNAQNTDMLMNNCEFSQYYSSIVDICQQKFNNFNPNSGSQLTKNQKQCFSNFLKNIYAVDDECIEQYVQDRYVPFLINWNYLSQFLIQSAQKNQNRFVTCGLQVYQVLSKIKSIKLQVLLAVRKGRNQEDLVRIFTSQKYFCYFKTGQSIMKILINLLSKSSAIIKVLMQVRLFDSICSFFENEAIVDQPVYNIILIFDLLTLMVECQRQIRPEGKNQIAKIIAHEGLLKSIQKVQNHQNSEVFHKSEMFIKYLQTFL